jgi:N-acetyl-anhydromuramoyl-L-alanine amidase
MSVDSGWDPGLWSVREDLPFLLPVPSPNHNARREPPKVIVMHADASPDEGATLRWMSRPESQVSYHILIGRRGSAYRCVEDGRRAWANGQSKLVLNGTPRTDLNGLALNLAFANRNDGREPLTTLQIGLARSIIQWWGRKFPALSLVTTHAAVAMPTGRKSDPERAPNFTLADYPLR